MTASDVIVIGGGLVGSAVAWGLAREGARVTVLDEGDDAFRASRGNFGLVWVQGKGDGLGDYATWTRRSAEVWPTLAATLAEETGIDVGLRQPGGLHPCLDGDEYQAVELKIRRMHNQPGVGENDTRMIDAGEARDLVPGLGPEVVGGSFCPHDGHVSPLHLLRALHAANAGRHVDYRPEHRVTAIAPGGGGFTVRTERGDLSAARIVLAAGLGNGRLAPMVGLDVPTAPERGHIVVTERLPPMLDLPIHEIRQTEEGSVMLGASAERVGFDTGINLDMPARIAARAVRTLPALATVRFVRTWSALRIMSPDGFPIYEESRRHPGAFVVTCHSGVTLAGAHGLELARHLLGDGFNVRFAAFSANRFRSEGDVPTAA